MNYPEMLNSMGIVRQEFRLSNGNVVSFDTEEAEYTTGDWYFFKRYDGTHVSINAAHVVSVLGFTE